MEQIDTPRPTAPAAGIGELLGRAFYAAFGAVMNTLDLVMTPIQRAIGVRNMAYLFVLPNLLIFAVFVLAPMLLNFYYAMTGGTALFPQDRPFVGMANFGTLFDCGISRPEHLPRGSLLACGL